MVAASVILRAFLVASARCEGLQRRPHLALESLGGWVVGVVAKGNERNSQLQLTESESVSQAVQVHVHLPSRQDAQPPVPWRHTVEGADLYSQAVSRTRPESELSQVTIAKQVIK